MAVYKIPQDIEADDKFLGPLTLKPFIFAGVGALSTYIAGWALVKGFWPVVPFILPIIIVTGFLAWPWSRDQPTEIWLAARIRFFLKPRRRVWNQDGMLELVNINVPRKIEHNYTDGLNKSEVNSRLKALASTLDSRGWAVKNVNVNMYSNPDYNTFQDSNDRLVAAASLPQEVVSVDVGASDDMLDTTSNPMAHHMDELMQQATEQHRQQIIASMQSGTLQSNPTSQLPKAEDDSTFDFSLNVSDPQSGDDAPPSGFATFQVAQTVTPGTQAQDDSSYTPSSDEEALLEKIHEDESGPNPAYGHTRTIQPLSATSYEPLATDQDSHGASGQKQEASGNGSSSGRTVNPDILNLAKNDDLNVETLQRQANRTASKQDKNDEVVITLR